MERYTEQETRYLLANYATEQKDVILTHIHKSWHSIQKKAHKLKIKRFNIQNKGKNYGKYSRLLNNEPETFYWIGLLMADGHFDKRGFISISLKDREHVNRFRRYLGLPESNVFVLTISDRLVFDELTSRYGVGSNKTYEPCVLTSFIDNNDAFFSFIIGFIDGDGSIDKKGGIRIKCHSSWLDNITAMMRFLDVNNPGARIDKKGLGLAALNKRDVCREIKKRALDLNLPLLTRKWSRIDEYEISKQQKKQYCLSFFDRGLTPKDVIQLKILSTSFIHKVYRSWLSEKP